jgi:hypothetical protein
MAPVMISLRRIAWLIRRHSGARAQAAIERGRNVAQYDRHSRRNAASHLLTWPFRAAPETAVLWPRWRFLVASLRASPGRLKVASRPIRTSKPKGGFGPSKVASSRMRPDGEEFRGSRRIGDTTVTTISGPRRRADTGAQPRERDQAVLRNLALYSGVFRSIQTSKDTRSMRKFILAAITVATLASAAAFADNAMTWNLQTTDMLSTNIVGLDVYDAQRNDIGKIQDIIIADGKMVKGYVLSVGRFLGMGTHYVAVDPATISIRYDQDSKKWRAETKVTKEQLKAAPEFKYEGQWQATKA